MVGVAPDVLMKFMYSAQTLIKSLLPGLFYFFFAVFPTRSPIDRKLPWLKWALLLVGVCLGWGGILPRRSGSAAVCWLRCSANRRRPDRDWSSDMGLSSWAWSRCYGT